MFVQNGDVVCRLQTDFDDNEYQKGSKAQQKDLERYIVTNEVGEDEAKKLKAEFKADREKYLDERKDKPKEANYFPSGGLAEHDYVLVIRTKFAETGEYV